MPGIEDFEKSGLWMTEVCLVELGDHPEEGPFPTRVVVVAQDGVDPFGRVKVTLDTGVETYISAHKLFPITLDRPSPAERRVAMDFILLLLEMEDQEDRARKLIERVTKKG